MRDVISTHKIKKKNQFFFFWRGAGWNTGTPIPRLGRVMKGFGSLVVTRVDHVNSTKWAVFQLFLRSAVLSFSTVEITAVGSEVDRV